MNRLKGLAETAGLGGAAIERDRTRQGSRRPTARLARNEPAPTLRCTPFSLHAIVERLTAASAGHASMIRRVSTGDTC